MVPRSPRGRQGTFGSEQGYPSLTCHEEARTVTKPPHTAQIPMPSSPLMPAVPRIGLPGHRDNSISSRPHFERHGDEQRQPSRRELAAQERARRELDQQALRGGAVTGHE
jgi:hypothetical protein